MDNIIYLAVFVAIIFIVGSSKGLQAIANIFLGAAKLFDAHIFPATKNEGNPSNLRKYSSKLALTLILLAMACFIFVIYFMNRFKWLAKDLNQWL